MKTGALVMLDALGFKGIWNRAESDEVIAKLRELRDRVENLRDKTQDLFLASSNETHALSKAFKTLSIDTKFLSDTIVIGVSCDETDRFTLGRMLTISCYITAQALALALLTPPALAFRGSIAVGQFLMDDNFILGPAVDDAAEHMNLAEGAFVWMAPSARAHEEAQVDSLVNILSANWPVPLKGGSTYRTRVVLPFTTEGEIEAIKQGVQMILATFTTGKMAIEIKRQNTEDFLISAVERIQRSTNRKKTPSDVDK